jgi:hypothetical protein
MEINDLRRVACVPVLRRKEPPAVLQPRLSPLTPLNPNVKEQSAMALNRSIIPQRIGTATTISFTGMANTCETPIVPPRKKFQGVAELPPPINDKLI